VTGLNGGIPGEEHIQTGTTCCHLDPNIIITGTAICGTLQELCMTTTKKHQGSFIRCVIPISPALSRICCAIPLIAWTYRCVTSMGFATDAGQMKRLSLQKRTGSTSWCVHGMPTSVPDSINKFTQNNPLTGFI
jgi:hypothetical protein